MGSKMLVRWVNPVSLNHIQGHCELDDVSLLAKKHLVSVKWTLYILFNCLFNRTGSIEYSLRLLV